MPGCPGRKAVIGSETVLVECPGCGHEVELFGDEARVHCRCGHWVFRVVLPSCAQWCKEADRCFGTIGPVPKILKDTCSSDDLKEQEDRLRKLQYKVNLAMNTCPCPDQKKNANT